MKTKVAISVINDLVTDQRVHKVATTLVNNGFEVLLIGRKLPESFPVKRSYPVKRFTIWVNKGPLFYAFYNIRLFFFLLFSKFDIYLSNDLDTLPANYLVSKIKRKKIVYDSHEFFTEVPELINRKSVRNIWLFIEKRILPGLRYSYTVSDDIAAEYFIRYNLKMSVIYNYPLKNSGKINSNPFPSEKKIIIYQGALNVDRGIEKMIAAMQYINNALFVIIGDGDITSKLKSLASELKIEDKVLFTGRLPFEGLNNYTINAHLGVSLEEPTNLNYIYSMPNKLFDYIQAEIPVLVSDIKGMRKIVEKYNVGIVLSDTTVENIASAINQIFENPLQMKIWKENLQKAALELCWEKQEQSLLNFFRGDKSVV